jgi:hypothetical protein
MNKQTVKVSEIFVPGGLPQYTYVSRTDRGLEERIKATVDNLCKITTVTGQTKSGKTVLVKKVLQTYQPIWLDGGTITSLDDFIEQIGDQLDATFNDEVIVSKDKTVGASAEIEAEANLLFLKGKGKFTPTADTRSGKQEKKVIARSPKLRVANLIRELRRPVVIDDFHYLKAELQGQVTRYLKPLVFDGAPVIYLAIPHRRYDAVKVEREMNGRIEHVQVPPWDIRELTRIAQLGFPRLNIEPHFETSTKLAGESLGSPHLMQEFCKKICYDSGVNETTNVVRKINPRFPYENIFRVVASDLGRNIFEKLARGPRTRADRKQRLLKTGDSADIYCLVLLALAELKPTLESIDYEALRRSMREILAGDLPQVNEVTRVLEHMAKIASLDQISVSVLDYEKEERRLHITDPFFAFFLRWGRDNMKIETRN